jgi:hypothetical protein
VGATQCSLPDPSAGTELDYTKMKGFVLEKGEEPLLRFAPIFLVEAFDKEYNRVGTPSARFDKKHNEEIYVDPAKATYYTEIIPWESGSAKYTNLVYRVHFEMSRSNSKSRDGGKGRNVGCIVIVTLNEAGKPVYFNSTQTCGCFHAILPTTFTPEEAYPKWWNKEAASVYGENLPGIMNYPEDFADDVRPVVFLRDGNHRTADVQLASIGSVRETYELVPASVAPMESLKHLPLGDGETSFYFEEGKKKGLVKGAYKRTEALALGAWIGDSRVGQDRIYGGEEELPRGFYTTIKRKEKDASDMWDYAGFLTLNGWKP